MNRPDWPASCRSPHWHPRPARTPGSSPIRPLRPTRLPKTPLPRFKYPHWPRRNRTENIHTDRWRVAHAVGTPAAASCCWPGYAPPSTAISHQPGSSVRWPLYYCCTPARGTAYRICLSAVACWMWLRAGRAAVASLLVFILPSEDRRWSCYAMTSWCFENQLTVGQRCSRYALCAL
jgi:hypothetical protein